MSEEKENKTELSCLKCGYFVKGCFCTKLNHLLESGYAMRYHGGDGTEEYPGLCHEFPKKKKDE